MNFFKRLFSSDKENERGKNEAAIQGVYSEEHFKKRYKEENIYDNPIIIDGCMKMLQSFYLDNKLEQKIQQPINHPINLDQVVNEGLGFYAYCKTFELDDSMIAVFLAMGFNDFLINKYGFKLYKDNEPEHPLRASTLKYDRKGCVLSLYPIEYAIKVLNHESLFEDLHTKIDGQIETLPQANDFLEKHLKNLRESGE